MRFALLIIIFIVRFSGLLATFYKTNITDFSKCKVHYSIQEKTYKVFYHLDETTQPNTGNDTLLDFHFSVLGISDAHILLAPSSAVSPNDPVYEIVIGAGGNTFCDIRRKQKSNVRQSVRLKGLLSAVDVRSFWIHIYKDGTIDVGKEGEELSFLSWKDPDLLPINVFSFSTWGNIEAKWFFDCPREGHTTNSTKIEPVLTDVEKLRKDLLSTYDPYKMLSFQNAQTEIDFKILSHFISLDEKTSTMNLKGQMLLEWIDEKLIWNPEIYGNIKNIHVYHGEIWRPDLYISNSRLPEESDAFNGRMLVVSNNGKVHLKTSMDIYTFCDLSSLSNWPNDAHSCGVEITFRGRHLQDFQLTYSANDSIESHVIGKEYMGEWEILETDIIVKYWDEENNEDSIYTNENAPVIKLMFTMKRASAVFGKALFTPYFLIATLVLVSFWCSSFSYIKISLLCLQLILSNIILIGLLQIMPGHPTKIPFLVYLYSTSIIVNIACIFIQIIVINLSRREHMYNPPHYIVKILNFNLVQGFLCLPCLPEEKVETWYGKLNKEFSFKKPTVQDMWIRLGTAIDRIGFFVFFLLFSINALITN